MYNQITQKTILQLSLKYLGDHRKWNSWKMASGWLREFCHLLITLFSSFLLSCSPSSTTDKAFVMLNAWGGSWRRRNRNASSGCHALPWRQDPHWQSFHSPASKGFDFVDCSAKNSLLLLFHWVFIVLAPCCAMPNTDAKSKRSSGREFMPTESQSPSTEEPLTAWPGWNEFSPAAAATVHGPVRMWHLTLSFKMLPALCLFHSAASGTQMLS